MRQFYTGLRTVWIVCLSGLVCRAGEFGHDYDPPKPGSYSLPVIKPAGDGALLDVNGNPIALRDLTDGRITVLSFIYTRCSAVNACPMATGVLSKLYRESAEDRGLADRLRLVSLSFDPEKDTPQRMAAYASVAAGRSPAASWRFVTTRSQRELQPILEAFGQSVEPNRNAQATTGPLNHVLRVFLIDASGDIRNIYSAETLDPRLVLADIRTLALEEVRR